jgi:hypothetical protein
MLEDTRTQQRISYYAKLNIVEVVCFHICPQMVYVNVCGTFTIAC